MMHMTGVPGRLRGCKRYMPEYKSKNNEILGPKKILCPKKFCVQKIFWVQKNLGQKKLWVNKNFLQGLEPFQKFGMDGYYDKFW